MKITVDNFQSLGHVEVDAQGLTVLVGPSDRGKSALIRAIEAALFNRPGDTFVRAGAKVAEVRITDLPALDGSAHTVHWKKGKTSNEFTIDGAKHAKVGKDAPKPLQEFGYTDVFVGDKDRKDGEWVRPQVATQFEPLFLLTRAGSFIADVLNLVTRHAVLQTAVGRAATDLGRKKSTAGALRTLLGESDVRSEALAAVPDFVARVKALRADAEVVQAQRTEIAHLRTLAARRTVLQALEALRAPAIGLDPATLDRVQTVVGFITLTRRKQALTPVARAPLPTQADASEVHAQEAARRHLGRLAAARRGVAGVPADLPKVREPFTPIVEEGLKLRDTIATLQASYQAAVFKARHEESVVSGASEMLLEAESELLAFKEETKVCPVCEKPWEATT